MYYDGDRLDPDDTLVDIDAEDGDRLVLRHQQIGGKPVIYLSSLTELTAKVRLDLVSQWELSAIYPVVHIVHKPSERLHETIEWDVRTCADGSLVQTDTGLEIAYLFYEAATWTISTIFTSALPHLRLFNTRPHP
ncbi:hypothetical protein BDV98DRAFT_303961 [Pterulicium gracile]|uniref:Ubiquitin-like domain-containing protein n=1 Tax=Pterulicium gracile TaxID=1884261 RepID=A0A5C3Q3F4_9AGAR|nr:hypothetical protein BDV98DRAFT_303961 [Pterula gracilis]